MTLPRSELPPRAPPAATAVGRSASEPSALGPLGAHEGLFAALADHAPVGIFVCNASGACVFVNERLCALAGRTSETMLGDGWALAVHPDDAERVEAAWIDASANGTDVHAEFRYLRPDGGVRWVEATAAAVRDADGQLLGWVGCSVDLTARKLSEDRYSDLFEHATDAIFSATVTGRISAVNEAGQSLTGYTRDELVGMNMFDLVTPEDRVRAHATFERRLSGGELEVPEYQMLRKNGGRVFIELAGRSIMDDRRVVGIEAIVRDTSDRHALEDELRRKAMHDPLTGLPNRSLFHDRLRQALARGKRSGSKVAVMLLDLDGFKLVNDSLGHHVGDELLIGLAPRLQRELRASDSVARLGGDEFALLIEDFEREQQVVAIAARVLAAVAEPTLIGQSELQVTASIGIAIAKPDETAETALGNADNAMYKAKSAGAGYFEIYNDTMRFALQRELMLTQALTAALRAGETDVHYQPIVSLVDGRILAVEALARWSSPALGRIEPGEFIPLAEDHELIVALGQQVLRRAARQTADWRAKDPCALPLGTFVNVSPRELAQPDFVEIFTQTLEQAGVAMTDIGIEITERVLIDEANIALTSNLDQLVRLGVRLVLDDFGTGYASLTALKQLPLTALKIDGSFTKAILTPTDTAPVCNAMISLGHTLALTVIAEGVETQLQADYLTRHGCDAAQGFHYGRPQSAERMTALLEADVPKRRRRASKQHRRTTLLAAARQSLSRLTAR